MTFNDSFFKLSVFRTGKPDDKQIQNFKFFYILYQFWYQSTVYIKSEHPNLVWFFNNDAKVKLVKIKTD